MTDSALYAKSWLKRSDELENERKRIANRVLFLQSKVNNCVVNYDSSGQNDPITAREKHEDMLIEYSSACSELEEITERVLHEDNQTIKVMEKLPQRIYAIILFDRFVNRLAWKEMIKCGRYELKRHQLNNIQNEALDALGLILKNDY